MGRPKQDQLNVPVEQRIEEAFWALSKKSPIERISVVALSKEAHCNRGTFYYYFDDIYELLDRIIEKNVPTTLPNYVKGVMGGELDANEIKRAVLAERKHIDRLASLLARSTSPYTTRRLKNAAINVWAKSLGLTAETLDKADRMFFEFMASGLFGVLAHHAADPSDESYEALFQALLPEVPTLMKNHIQRRTAEGHLS